MKNITKDWLESAESDLETIKEIIHNDILTYIIAFHSQQAIEKSFKAMMEEKGVNFIKTHDLVTLYGKIKKFIDFNIEISILELLDKLYIDSRYPGNLGLLPYGKPTLEDAKKFYRFALEVFEKVKNNLEKD